MNIGLFRNSTYENMFDGIINSYYTQFIRFLCNKKEEKKLFGSKAIKYDKEDFEKIRKATKVELHFLSYEDDKELKN